MEYVLEDFEIGDMIIYEYRNNLPMIGFVVSKGKNIFGDDVININTTNKNNDVFIKHKIGLMKSCEWLIIYKEE